MAVDPSPRNIHVAPRGGAAARPRRRRRDKTRRLRYDAAKSLARRAVGEDRAIAERVVAALCGGLATALVGAPFDTVKTRLMSRRETPFSGPLHCVAATARTEGVLALYKGFLPVYGRQAPFNLLNFLIMEHLLDLARPGTT